MNASHSRFRQWGDPSSEIPLGKVESLKSNLDKPATPPPPYMQWGDPSKEISARKVSGQVVSINARSPCKSPRKAVPGSPVRVPLSPLSLNKASREQSPKASKQSPKSPKAKPSPGRTAPPKAKPSPVRTASPRAKPSPVRAASASPKGKPSPVRAASASPKARSPRTLKSLPPKPLSPPKLPAPRTRKMSPRAPFASPRGKARLPPAPLSPPLAFKNGCIVDGSPSERRAVNRSALTMAKALEMETAPADAPAKMLNLKQVDCGTPNDSKKFFKQLPSGLVDDTASPFNLFSPDRSKKNRDGSITVTRGAVVSEQEITKFLNEAARMDKTLDMAEI